MVDQIYDIFEITGAQKWVPAQFRDSDEANARTITHVDDFLSGPRHGTLKQPSMQNLAPGLTAFLKPKILPNIASMAYTTSKCSNGK